MRTTQSLWLFVALALTLSLTAFGAYATGIFFGHAGFRDASLKIPITDPSGHSWMLQGHICFPDGIYKPRVVLINHGSPARSSDRPGMHLASCRSEAVQWFLQRHYAVAQLFRLGYGATGGPWTESYGKCEDADYYHAGMETARQIDAMVNALGSLPEVNPDGVIVVGQSAGGWGVLTYDSMPHPHVAAFIDMAGGRGGHMHNQPDQNCHPERLVDAAARFGKTATTPVLWIDTKNDSFFNPNLSTAMARNFNQAGGKAKFTLAGSYDDEGHHLFFGNTGSYTWGPLVDAYLKTIPGISQ